MANHVTIRRAVLLVPLLLATMLAVPAAAQVAAISLSTSIGGPSGVTVGDSGVPGSITVTNNSTNVGPVIFGVFYHPSCADFDLACNAPEPFVFSLSPTATGTCSPQPLGVTGPDQSGRFTFESQSSMVLATGASCTINFTFDVARMPNTDARPGDPGVQTTRSALVQATAEAAGGGTVSGTSRAIASITVLRAQASIATLVPAPVIPLGLHMNDLATVTGAPLLSVTGTVTFNLYGPDNATCTGPPVFTSTAGLVQGGSGAQALSGSYTATATGIYRFVATYNGDANHSPVTGACNDPNETFTVMPGGRYVPLTPARILDTRDGTGGIAGAVGPGSTTTVQITGQGGVPVTGVTAVAMNVTVTQPTGDGYLTLYPTGTTRPLAANLNFTPGKTVPNLVVVKLGTNGRVDMFNSAGSTHVIYDVTGYFSDDPTGDDGRYVPLTPARILDTRSSVRLGPGASLDLQVSGQGGVPVTGAEAVVMNVAVTNTTSTSYLTVHPTGEARPLAANLNWVAGDTVSNRVFAKLGAGGAVTIYNNAGDADVVVDVNAWFTDVSQVDDPFQGAYVPLTPARLLDTRVGMGGTGTRPAGSTVDIQVAGQAGVPGLVWAVVLNVTVVGPAGPGYLTIFPTGTAQPFVSDLNYTTGETRPNLVVVRLGVGGKLSLFTPTGTDVVIDVAGFFF